MDSEVKQIVSEFNSIDLELKESPIVVINELKTQKTENTTRKRTKRRLRVEEESNQSIQKRKRIERNENKENIEPKDSEDIFSTTPVCHSKTVSSDQNKKDSEECDKEVERVVNSSTSGVETDYSSNEELNESLLETKEKLVPTLEAFVFRGCLHKFQRKSKLITEYWKYCRMKYQSMETLVKNTTTYNLVVEKRTVELVMKKCPNLRCLRLSNCRVDLNLMKSLTTLERMTCLHLEHISGIQSDDEWTQVGVALSQQLVCLAFNAHNLAEDMSGMLSELIYLQNLTLEEYNHDVIKLFSTMTPQISKISLNNYLNVDAKAMEVLALRLGKWLFELEIDYDYYHPNRANAHLLLDAICRTVPSLRVLKFRIISLSNLRPLFKLQELSELELLFSVPNFIDFPIFYYMKNLRNLSLHKTLFTPKRVLLLAKGFPGLRYLSLTGQVGKAHEDSPIFCCECHNKDKKHDNCWVCYEKCCAAFIEMTFLRELRLNYVRVKSLFSTVIQYIPQLDRLVINPFECDCGYPILFSAIKAAEFKPLTLEIRNCFISNALLELEVPENLQIIDYNTQNDK